MNTRIIAIFVGIAVLLVAITGYAGSLNASMPAASGSTSVVSADVTSQTPSNQASGTPGEMTSNIAAGQFTLENAPGRMSSQ